MTTKEKFLVLLAGEPLKKADAIILLEGDGLDRVPQAASLYKEKWAHLIVVSGGADDPGYGSYPNTKLIPKLKKLGVSNRDIIIEDKSQNTREQAVEVLKIAKEKGWSRLLLVASHGNQHRAFLAFLKVMKEMGLKLDLINTPARLLWFKENPWGSRFNLLDQEFDRIEKYTKLGHLATIEEAIEYLRQKEAMDC